MNTRALLARLLDLAGGPADTGYVLALADPALAEVGSEFQTPKVRYHVFRPASELGLRRLVWKMGSAPFLAIIDRKLKERLPLDLLLRARGGMVHQLELHDVLSLALGVTVVPPDDPGLRELVLEHLDDLHVALGRRTLPTVVGRDLLEQLLLEVLVNSEVRESNPATILARWIVDPPTTRWSAPVRALLRRHLPTLQGQAGEVLAFGLDDASLLRELIVRGLLLAVDEEELPPAIWGERLKPLLKQPAFKHDPARLRELLRDMAVDACDVLGDKARELFDEAEREAREKLKPSVLSRSPVLPLGLENRMVELAKKAVNGDAITASEVSWLKAHRAARFHEAEIHVLEQMARLSRYLSMPPADSTGDVVSRVLDYQRHGAFADLTAMRLRSALASTGQRQAEARVLLDRWRDRRDAENFAFATVLAGGYERVLFADGLTPLPRLWKHHVLPELEREPGRGIFLVVLDGCSYPVFLELVTELSRLPKDVVGFRSLEGSDWRNRGLPALAPLPTITSHSRGALFLGEVPSDPLVPEAVFAEQGEGATDPPRFARNPFLGGRSRKLFLKGDLADGGAALIAALEDEKLDVVAAVFNAVDDLIGSASTGVAFEVKPQQIAGFIPSLQQALRAGRHVLVTADHGFSPFLSKELKAGSPKGGDAHRYLELQPRDEPPDGFIEIDVHGLGGQPERRLAFAWKVGAYLRKPQVGFHGGCGLEEMVVPMAWLVSDGCPPDLPVWWADITQQKAAPAPQPARAPVFAQSRPPKKPEPRQGDFFHEPAAGPELARVLADRGLPSAVVDALDETQRAALVRLAEVGTARSTDLAKAVGRAPSRMSGLMTKLQRQLHQAGADCFRREELADGEVQYVWMAPGGPTRS